MKPLSQVLAKQANPHIGFGVDHRLFFPLWAAIVDFNKTPGRSAQMLEGLRDEKRQAYLRQQGSTQLVRSKHQSGLAIDVAVFADGKYCHDIDPHYRALAEIVKRYDADYNVQSLITWGGNWKGFPDGAHFEL